MKSINQAWLTDILDEIAKGLSNQLKEDKEMGHLRPYERGLRKGAIVAIEEVKEIISEHEAGVKKPRLSMIQGGLKDR